MFNYFYRVRKEYEKWKWSSTPRKNGVKTRFDIGRQADKLTYRITDEAKQIRKDYNRGKISFQDANKRIIQLNKRYDRVQAAGKRLSEEAYYREKAKASKASISG